MLKSPGTWQQNAHFDKKRLMKKYIKYTIYGIIYLLVVMLLAIFFYKEGISII